MRHVALCTLAAALLCPTGLLAADDKPASTGRMVSIEIVIAQLAAVRNDVDLNLEAGDKVAARVAELEKQGQISHLTRMRLSTLDQQPAQLQFGERTPVATGRSRVSPFGRAEGRNPAGVGNPNAGGPAGGGGSAFATSYTLENVGTMINVVPMVQEDGSVTLKLELAKSQIEPAAAGEAGADANDAPPSRTVTLQSQSTLRLRSGQTAVVSQSQSSAKGEASQAVILISARVSDAPAPVKTASAAE